MTGSEIGETGAVGLDVGWTLCGGGSCSDVVSGPVTCACELLDSAAPEAASIA